MENFKNSVSVVGFPQGLNKIKIKLFVKKHIGSGVKSVEKEGDLTIITFENFEGLQRFHNVGIRNIEFGGSVHAFTILKQDKEEDEDLHKEPYHESSPPQPRARVHGNSPNKTWKQNIILLDCLTQETLFTNVHYWSDLPVLPAPERTDCVLAQNISPANQIQKMTLHFQNKKRNGGGPIKCFIQMVDGLLVVFKDKKDCESCLNMIDQSLGGEKITIYRKVIPEYYPNKFVLEVVGESKTFDHETLELYLESCSPSESCPVSCDEQKKSGVYLIEYGDDYDISETGELMKKIHSERLEGKSLKASPLLKTDCLKVMGVTSDISNDAMRLLFESGKRTNGGPVTRIDRLKTQSALVYFASYIVAEKVYKKIGGGMEICKHPVKIELYHHSVSNDHNDNIITNFQQTSIPQKEAEKDQPGSFLLKPSCDDAIFNFISGNRSHAEKLKQFFKNIAEVKFMSQPDLQFEFTPLKDCKDSKENFTKYCEKTLNLFLSEYATVSCTFERSRLDRARSQDLYPELEQRYKRNPNSDAVIICWKSNEPVVQITGLQTSVEQMSKNIETRVNSIVVRTKSTQRQFRTYCYCGIVDEIRKMYPDVKIEIDEKNFVLQLTGLESMVYTANMQAMTMLNEIDKKRLTGLEESIISFISDFLSHKSDLDMKLNKKFKSAGIMGVIELNGDELCLKVKPNEDYKKAVEVIKQFIIVEEIGTDESESRVVTSSSWREFQQKLQKGLYSIHITSNKNILMTGLREEIKMLRMRIKKFLDENSLKTFSLPMAYGRARYILERSYEFSRKSCENAEIECGLTPENGGGIFVKGKKRALDIAIPEAQKLQEKIQEYKHCLNEPGIRQHYQNPDGVRFIKSTELLTECIILTLSPECEEWVKFNKRVDKSPRLAIAQSSAVDFQEFKVASYIFNSVELSVWKTDIIEHKCDVIVNASNPELTLGGGISGAIRARDEKNGNGQVQKEMDAIIKKNYGSILVGDAVITSAGNLPACKKIVHAVGPRWDTSGGGDPKQILKASVSNSLKRVDEAGLKSIAFPAISCGVFGGHVDVCIPLIQEAVYDYFTTTQNSGIKKVHFVENGRQNILDAFSKFPESKMQQKQTTPAHTGHVQSVQGGVSQQVASTVQVQLIQGDIVSYQADVIVNATTVQSLTKMVGGPAVSQALAQVAGPSVLRECAQLRLPYDLGKVFETNAGGLSCQKLYHALVTNYDANSSKSIIDSVVSKCLNMADNAQYSTIVFPAIGTGGFKYPPQLVAKWMRQQILSFQGKYLKSVVIVLYPQNIPVINAFNAEFNSTTPIVPGSQSSPPQSPKVGARSKKRSSSYQYKKIDGSSASFGPLVVSVYQGDITSEDSDVIVNSTNSQFDLGVGMVSQQILAKGGSVIQDEALKGSGFEYRVTSGGKLFCKNIIQLVTPREPNDLQKKIVKLLQEVENLQLSSVSIPALGTGNLGLNTLTVGAIMRDSIEKFISSNRSINYLDTINIVVWEKAKLQPFKDAILNKHPKKGLLETLVGFGKDVRAWFTGSWSEENAEESSFLMYFYALNQEDIEKAISYISHETGKQMTKQNIDDDVIGRLTKWENFEIDEIRKTRNVKIDNTSNSYLNRFVFIGLTTEVMEALLQVKEILRKLRDAENCAAYVTWQKKTSSSWENYLPRAAHVLEIAYQAHLKKKTTDAPEKVKVPEFKKGAVTHHSIDISSLFDQKNQSPPKVRRQPTERSASDLPASWDEMKIGTQSIQIDLQTGSQEYQNVLTKFQAGGVFHNTIVSIERIQNISLYKQYIAKKAEVTEKLKNFQKPIEQQLFHGTSNDDDILIHGFDRSYAGKHATAYGRGVYFATTAGFSHGYAAPNTNGNRRMFLADVITGDYCAGNASMVAPPIRANTSLKNDLYDSVVDKPMTPTIYVIFKDASAYPTYLITYM